MGNESFRTTHTSNIQIICLYVDWSDTNLRISSCIQRKCSENVKRSKCQCLFGISFLSGNSHRSADWRGRKKKQSAMRTCEKKAQHSLFACLTSTHVNHLKSHLYCDFQLYLNFNSTIENCVLFLNWLWLRFRCAAAVVVLNNILN